MQVRWVFGELGHEWSIQEQLVTRLLLPGEDLRAEHLVWGPVGIGRDLSLHAPGVLCLCRGGNEGSVVGGVFIQHLVALPVLEKCGALIVFR